ncbi:hypothetical protein IFM89_029008, partial [Coptis chinensis]
RLGQIENARQHLCFHGLQHDQVELQKLQLAERHLNRCLEARKIRDWKSAMREGDAAITAEADSFPQLFAYRAEALLELHQLVDADGGLSNIPKFEDIFSFIFSSLLLLLFCLDISYTPPVFG